MREFVAGATRAIGTQLVPRLVAAGHEVHGMTRSESKRAMLHDLGAAPVVADALDPDQVAEAGGEAVAVLMTELRGASNAKAKRELGWQPAHPSRRQGFAT